VNSRFLLRLAFIFLTFISGPISASAIDDTNQASLAIPPPAVKFDVPAPPSDRFIRRIFEEMTSSDSTVFDRFTGPAPKLDWTRRQDRYGSELIDRWNSAGASMFASIGAALPAQRGHVSRRRLVSVGAAVALLAAARRPSVARSRAISLSRMLVIYQACVA